MATDPIVAPPIDTEQCQGDPACEYRAWSDGYCVNHQSKRCPDCAERLIAANQARCFICAQETECDDPSCGCHEALRIPSQHIRRCAECGAPVAYVTRGREKAPPFGPAAEPYRAYRIAQLDRGDR